jgi:hypothetical protein
MVKEQISSKMVTPIQESTKMENPTVRVNIHGRMDLSMLVNSDRVLSMEKGAGRVLRVLNQAISMKATTSTIRSTAMVCLPGLAAINTKVSTERMSETGMER